MVTVPFEVLTSGRMVSGAAHTTTQTPPIFVKMRNGAIISGVTWMQKIAN